MRKYLAIALLIPTIALASCDVTTGVKTIQAAVVGVKNPVTKQELYTVENGAIVAFAGLNAYKQACLSGAADTACKINIRFLQGYTRQLQPIIADLRRFVKNNDQVNARVAYDTATSILSDIKAFSTANGVKVQ